MKTMNNLILMAIVLFSFACANETNSPAEELNAVNFQSSEFEEGGEFTELSLHRHFLESEFSELNCQKEQLMQAIEDGDDAMIPVLEETLVLIEQNHEFQEIVGQLLDKPCLKPKSCPPPPKPNPCTEGKGCQFSCPILIPEVLNIWVTEDQVDSINIQQFDSNGELCGELVDINPIEESNGFVGMTFETNNCCGGYIEVTKPFEYATSGEISYRVPVQCE